MAHDEWRDWWRRHGERELRCILMTAWDPVGAGHEPEAWDEYDDYALGVARRLRCATDPAEARKDVAEYLTQTEVESMGIESEERAELNGHLATALVAWHEWSYRHSGRPPGEVLNSE